MYYMLYWKFIKIW